MLVEPSAERAILLNQRSGSFHIRRHSRRMPFPIDGKAVQMPPRSFLFSLPAL